MNFAEKLLNLRVQGGYSQEALSEQLCVSRQAISKWETGATLPETEKLLCISDFFNVSIDYLLKETAQIGTHETLDRAVLKFVGSAQDMDAISKRLVEIMKDGAVDSKERLELVSIMNALDEVSGIIDEIKQRMKGEQ